MVVMIRKWVSFVEEIMEEINKPLARPLLRATVAVVVKNTYAGSNPDGQAQLFDLGEYLGDEFLRRCGEALGTSVAVRATPDRVREAIRARGG